MSPASIDRNELIELLDGNAPVIVTIIDSFLDDCPDYMEGIRKGVETEDAELLERNAHGLKGSAGSIRARPASKAAEKLEEMGRTEEFSGADTALETLETEIEQLTEELRELRGEFGRGSVDS